MRKVHQMEFRENIGATAEKATNKMLFSELILHWEMI